MSGIRNPRSTEPTSGFVLTSYDSQNNIIANGTIGNVYMTQGGKFSDLKLRAANSSNGITTNYTVELIASIPVANGDVLEWTMQGLEIEAEPICSLIDGHKCPEKVECSQSKGKIRATFTITSATQECTNQGANFTFLVQNVKNAPTMVPSNAVVAELSTASYQLVGAYDGTLQIKNTAPGYLLKENIAIE